MPVIFPNVTLSAGHFRELMAEHPEMAETLDSALTDEHRQMIGRCLQGLSIAQIASVFNMSRERARAKQQAALHAAVNLLDVLGADVESHFTQEIAMAKLQHQRQQDAQQLAMEQAAALGQVFIISGSCSSKQCAGRHTVAVCTNEQEATRMVAHPENAPGYCKLTSAAAELNCALPLDAARSAC